ncbi:hypothetical protein FACS189468_6030 [Spirochaetia bacterium]|nr:hypothetical protein FACS189468_6030 [Spirochaetia bacterium]
MSNIGPSGVLKKALVPFKAGIDDLAAAIGVNTAELKDVDAGKKPITAKLALQLSKAVGKKPAEWLAVQNKYELAQLKNDAGIKAIKKLKAPAKRAAKKPAPAKKAAPKKNAKAAVKKAPKRASRTSKSN